MACGNASERRGAASLARATVSRPAAVAETVGGRSRVVVPDGGRAMAGGRPPLSLGVGRSRSDVRPVPALESGSGRELAVWDGDIDEELRLAEEAAAVTLRDLRARLAEAVDVQCQQLLCTAMAEAANAISACRKARRAGLRC